MTQWDGGPLFPYDSLTHGIIIKQQHVNLDCTRVIGLTRFRIKFDFFHSLLPKVVFSHPRCVYHHRVVVMSSAACSVLLL